MPATAIRHRDYRGGLNTSFPETLLTPNELRRLQNARVVDGLPGKRAGSRKIHDTQLFTPDGIKTVQGGVQWQPTNGVVQTICVANGDLRFKGEIDPDFFTATAGLSTTELARFAAYRSGTSLYLYVAAAGLKRWDGLTLSDPANKPANVTDVALYKNRMWAAALNSKKLYASKVADANEWLIANGGLEVEIETYDTLPVVGLVTCGASLIIAKANSLTRLTGVDANAINVDKESEGIAPEMGCIAKGTLIPVLGSYFFVSEQGPYLGNESSVEALGLKVRRSFDFYDRDLWAKAVAAHHAGRDSIWLTLPIAGTNGPTSTTWEYDYRNKIWHGPWTRGGAGILTALWPHHRSTGRDTILSGGRGGWVMEEDIPHWFKDDTGRLAADGTNVALTIDYPAAQVEDGTRLLNAREIVQHVEANLPTGASLTHEWFSELGSGSTVIPTGGPGLLDYPFKTDAIGTRIANRINEATDQYAEIGAVTINAEVGAEMQARPTSSPSATPGLARMASSTVHGQGTMAVTIVAGEAKQLLPIGVDAALAEAPVSGFVWSSSASNIVAVSQVGVISFVAVGSATITATGNGIVQTWTVTAVPANDGLEALITALGGDATVVAAYSARRRVVLDSAMRAVLWEDGRVATTTGRIFAGADVDSGSAGGVDFGNYTGLDGRAALTIGLWYAEAALRASLTDISVIFNSDQTTIATAGTWGIALSGTTITVYHNGSANFATAVLSAAKADIGPMKLFIVYNGAGATNADKLKLFVSYFNLVTQAWTAAAAAALTFFGAAVGATWPSAPASSTLRIGFRPNAGAAGLDGFVDELRVWETTNLSGAQIDAETIASNPIAASKRYQFNGNATNIGSQAGHNGTVGANVKFCSDDLRYGSPLVARTAALRPQYDGTARRLICDGTDDKLNNRDPRYDSSSAGSAMTQVYVGSIPVGAAARVLYGHTDGGNFWRVAYSGASASEIQHIGTPVVNKNLTESATFRLDWMTKAAGAAAVTGQTPDLGEQATGAGSNVAFYPLTIMDGIGSVVIGFLMVKLNLNAAQKALIRTWATTYMEAVLA